MTCRARCARWPHSGGSHSRGGTGQLARERYLESLQVARQSYELLEIARSLEGLAELYAAAGPERALRLAGAAGAMRKTIGAEPYAEELRRLNAWQQPCT